MYFNPTETGKRIKELREEHGYTQMQLAEMLNVNRSHIYRMEQGEKAPSIDLLVSLEEIFDESLDFLILGRDFQKKNVSFTNEVNQGNEIRKKEEMKEKVRSMIDYLTMVEQDL